MTCGRPGPHPGRRRLAGGPPPPVGHFNRAGGAAIAARWTRGREVSPAPASLQGRLPVPPFPVGVRPPALGEAVSCIPRPWHLFPTDGGSFLATTRGRREEQAGGPATCPPVPASLP